MSAKMSAAEKVEISYRGGMADAGQLHFYEYTRACYAFARLLNTSEHFRRTGRVAQKIGSKNYVELIIEAPRHGSFVTEVIVPALVDAVPKLAGVSIKGMISYIFHLLSPRSDKTNETVIELAKIRLAEEKERTKQSKQETRRPKALEGIIKTETASTRQALSLVREAIRSPNRATARLHDDPETFKDMLRELEAQRARENEIRSIEQNLKEMDPKSFSRLSSRVRPMVTEMGLPLRKGVKSFTIAAANDDKPIAYFDRARVDAIEARK